MLNKRAVIQLSSFLLLAACYGPLAPDTPFDYLNKADLVYYTGNTKFVMQLPIDDRIPGNSAKVIDILGASRSPGRWITISPDNQKRLIQAAKEMIDRTPIAGNAIQESENTSKSGLFTIDGAVGFFDERDNQTYHNVVLIICKTCKPRPTGLFVLQKTDGARMEASSIADTSEIVSELDEVSDTFRDRPSELFLKR